MERNTPVDVISVCLASGQIQPLRFRLEGEDHQLHRVDITRVVSVQEVAYVGVEAFVYLCQAEMTGSHHLFELRYIIRTHHWELLRWVY